MCIGDRVSSFWPLLLVIVVFAFFWNAALPQFEAITFNYLRDEADRYGQIRLWGSVGFIIASIGLGAWIERVGVTWLLYTSPSPRDRTRQRMPDDA